jgi:hypothetical protein
MNWSFYGYHLHELLLFCCYITKRNVYEWLQCIIINSFRTLLRRCDQSVLKRIIIGTLWSSSIRLVPTYLLYGHNDFGSPCRQHRNDNRRPYYRSPSPNVFGVARWVSGHPRGHSSRIMKHNVSCGKINIRDDTFYRPVDRTNVEDAFNDQYLFLTRTRLSRTVKTESYNATRSAW